MTGMAYRSVGTTRGYQIEAPWVPLSGGSSVERELVRSKARIACHRRATADKALSACWRYAAAATRLQARVIVKQQGLDPRPDVEPSPADLPRRDDAPSRPVLYGRSRYAQQGGDLGCDHHVGSGERVVDGRAHWSRVLQL